VSAAILDRARAFEMIAQHLPEQKRSEIAEAIADKLLAELGSKPKPPAAPAAKPEPAEVVDISEHTVIASFLADHGYERKALVDATLTLARWLTANEGRFTREAGMRIWLDQQRAAS